MKLNYIRTEAEDVARKFVATRINLFNQSNSSLTIGNCFDVVLLDPDRYIYLRQPPESRGYKVELLDTSI